MENHETTIVGIRPADVRGCGDGADADIENVNFERGTLLSQTPCASEIQRRETRNGFRGRPQSCLSAGSKRDRVLHFLYRLQAGVYQDDRDNETAGWGA